MNFKIGKLLSATILLASSNAFAAVYNVPPANESLIGQLQYNTTQSGDTVGRIQERYDVGYNALEKANPALNFNRELSAKAPIILPTQHLLPSQPRKGIVINLPEMRMYYYPKDSNTVLTYPIGIGKIGKTIPIAETSITKKTEHPQWVPPQDIREFNLAQGIILPQVMPAGPDNPLGPYAIYMRIPTYLIHSTIFPESVGKRASFGCIRMYESDIKSFFPTIEGGIPVTIVNAPIKVAWQDDRLYMEAHTPLEEHSGSYESTIPGMVKTIADSSSNEDTLVDWQAVSFMAKERDGMPHEIGMKLPQS